MKIKNLLVRTKFYWSWTKGLVLIVRTVEHSGNKEKNLFSFQQDFELHTTGSIPRIKSLIFLLIRWK